MNCDKYLNLIHDLVEGELDEQNAEQINLHIFICLECKSLFEMLKQEKEIYSRYLFEIEPPANLLVQFQSRLEIEEQKNLAVVKSAQGFSQHISNLFAFLRLNPAQTIAIALVLFVFGFSLFSFLKTNPSLDNNPSLPAVGAKHQLILPKLESEKPIEISRDDLGKLKDTSIKEAPKNIAIKQVVAKHSESPKRTIKEPAKAIDEDQEYFKELQDLEIAATKQLEKIELLLRSVRNAQAIDDKDEYDLSYEKQQARKLLTTNFELRQKTQIYGTLLTDEMLGRVEPYLLEIANLEDNPSTNKVLEIKERVRNQNIIASLQGF